MAHFRDQASRLPRFRTFGRVGYSSVMSQEILKEIAKLVQQEHRKLVKKMLEDHKAGRGYLEEDRVLLQKLNEADALLKQKMAPPPESWVTQVIRKLTEENGE